MNENRDVANRAVFTTKFYLTWLAAILAAGPVAVAVISPSLYRSLIEEDGWVEYGSAIFWVLAAIAVALTCHFTSRKRGESIRMLPALLLIIFFIACAGEEINWGQRIFHWRTPALLDRINVQHETSIHNIWKTSIFSNSFFILTTAFFVLLPLAREKYHFKGLELYPDAPTDSSTTTRIYAITLAAWIIVGIRCGTLGFGPMTVWGYYTQMDDELYEFLTAYDYFTFAFLGLHYAIKRDESVAALPEDGFATALPEPETG
jgi:hypothetical protein